MPTAIEAFDKLVRALSKEDGVTSGQMFGKACLKVNGKAFIAQHHDAVIFKLNGESHGKAVRLSDAVLWDPSGKGRPMKEWVALGPDHVKEFLALTKAALKYVGAA
ncbi:MAG TPA: hypothetical protein VK986_21365 [Tepidisphaeraceae bacterium]|nr:hypothetical protein [Tepidisphaeraceae bacterium]